MPVPLQFSRYVGSPDCPVHSYPTDLQRLLPGRVLPPSHLGSQPARAASDSERVTAFPTRYPPSVSTDRPGTGSDRIWVRSFANTGFPEEKDKILYAGSHLDRTPFSCFQPLIATA